MGDDHHTFSEFYSEKALCRGQHSYKKMKFVKEGGRVRPVPVEGVQTTDQIALSEELAPLFPGYLNSLGLKDGQGNALTLDDGGEGSFKEYIRKWLLASATGLSTGTLPWPFRPSLRRYLRINILMLTSRCRGDCRTAVIIFACTLGIVVSLVALPQLVIFLLLYYLAGVIFPMTTPAMIADFKACGGLIVFVTGFRMIRVKDFPVADMIPAMALVMPISWIWTAYILPVLS